MAQILRVGTVAAILFLAVAARAALLPLPAPDLAERAFLDGATPVPTADLRVIGLGPSGAIFVAGDFDSVDGMSRPHGVARLNPDGTLDAAWSPTLPLSRTAIRAVEAPDGAVAMAFLMGPAPSGQALVVIASGAVAGTVLDTTTDCCSFQSFAFGPGGALYVAKNRAAGSFPDLFGFPKTHYEVDVRKYTSAGVLDPTFGLLLTGDFNDCDFSIARSPAAYAILPAGGDVYIAGNFDAAANPHSSAAFGGAIRVSAANGDIDTGWAPMGPSGTPAAGSAKLTCFGRPSGVVQAIAVASDDSVYLGGPFQRQGRRFLAKFSKESGEPDAAWNPELNASVAALALDVGGSHLYVTGSFTTVDGWTRTIAALSTADATLSPTWDADVVSVGSIVATAQGVLLSGTFTTVSGEPRPRVAALATATTPFEGPLLEIEPSHVDLGDMRVNTSKQAVVTLRNAGGSPLTISSIVAPAPPPDGAFALTLADDCPASLAPAATCQVTAELSVGGMFFGSSLNLPITVTSDGTALPQQVIISAKVAAPAFPQTPSLQIPAPPLGHPMSATRTVTNDGNAPMAITGMTIESETRPGEFSVTHDCPASLAPGASCDATISYTPQGLGEAHAVVLVTFAELTYVYGAIGGYALEARFLASGQPAGPTDDSDGDGIPNGMEEAEGLDPVVKDNDIFNNARLFAMQQYRDFLAREGDPGGIAFWANQVGAGLQSRGHAIESFFNSQEFQGTIAPVARLYFAYFLRVPDYGGLTFWAQYYKANSLLAISNFFAVSPEFASTYGALGNAAFVTLVYNNVLGRAPDAAGHAFWTHQLDTGAMTRGQVMLGFSESAEYRALTRNEVYVTMMYIGMLRRAPDPGGFAFWVDYLDGGKSGLALIDGFLGSTEYRRRFLP